MGIKFEPLVSVAADHALLTSDPVGIVVVDESAGGGAGGGGVLRIPFIPFISATRA